MDRQLFIKLLKVLQERFGEEDLRSLYFRFGIDYDDLPGSGKSIKAIQLLQFLERRGRIPDLIEVGREERSDIDWEPFNELTISATNKIKDSVLSDQFFQVSNLLTEETQKLIIETLGDQSPPLDWDYPFQLLYTGEDAVLWIIGESGQLSFLPQVLILGPDEAENEETISVIFDPVDFQAPQRMKVKVGLDFYQRNSDGTIKKIFFDGDNARLVDWDSKTRKLTFQGNSYFEYLQTNLSLDYPLKAIGSLRNYLHRDGIVEPLNTSKLANTTGINGLLFSIDGFVIIQKRGDNVLIRPGELCSGFSGTVDRQDIVNAVNIGGRLLDLDTLREMAEEIGIRYREVATRRCLGVTRELIRGGAPEMFYALDIHLPADEILSRSRKDKEGQRKKIYLGPYAAVTPELSEIQSLPSIFWNLVDAIRTEGNGLISIPLLTNLALWYKRLCPLQVGVDSFPKE